jgi:hypothetical protein
MAQRPTFEELRHRLQQEIAHFGGRLPERNALAWDGYFAALIEWGLISVEDHKRICDMLPKIADNPVMAIFLGRGGTDETAAG